MFELGILGVILLAVGYWATLWMAGRRDDVLHGKFVQVEPGAAVKAGEPLSAPHVTPRASTESLQSLLAVIKQDLKDAAQR
jgi:hypothetical protein